MNFSQFSHKNILISGVIALAIISVGIYLKFFSQPRQESRLLTQDVGLSTSTPANADYTDRDTDGDGLPDWEERLYGSDPLKKDTDGDGTPDGAEVRQGRDPAKANTAKPGQPPNDMLTRIQDPHFATSSTDILGIKKEFFAKYLATQSKEIRETTYRDLLGSFDSKKFTPTKRIIDLNLSSDSDADALHTYGNAFGMLIIKYSARIHRNEVEILESGMKTHSDQTLAELQLPAVSYRNFSSDLTKLKAPSALAEAHLLITNGYERMSKGLLGMQHMYSNPIDGEAGYQTYTIGRVDVTKGYAMVVAYFSIKQVHFSPHEPGYPFYQREVVSVPTLTKP